MRTNEVLYDYWSMYLDMHKLYSTPAERIYNPFTIFYNDESFYFALFNYYYFLFDTRELPHVVYLFI